MFTIEGYDYEFRVKKLNAIETLALQSQINLKSVDAAQNFFNEVLKRIEVKAGDNWIACEENGVYYPAELVENAELTKKLIEYFMKETLLPVFPKSSESNK